MFQEGWKTVIPQLVGTFHACLTIGYIPVIHCQVTIALLPKPGTNSCTGPRDFGPTSLTSFLLKTMERPVDRCLRDGTLTLRPLHSKQHLQSWEICGNGPSSACGFVEMVLDQQATVLGVFLDISQTFNYTPFDSMYNVLVRCGISSTIGWWIRAILAMVTINDSSMKVAVSKGCPKGGVLSPLQWCLDDLIAKFNIGSTHTQG